MADLFNYDCYEDLANAVIYQAVKDYRHELVKEHKATNKEKKERAKDKITALERFFNSKEFNVWTTLDGPSLMRRIKDEVIEYDYNLKKLNHDHALTTI